MGILDMFFSKNEFKPGKYSLSDKFFPVNAEIVYKEYALGMAINKIANAIGQCDFNTLKKGKKIKGDIWYKLNVQPNLNQNSIDFWNEVVLKMINDPLGCLVIQSDTGDFLVTDSFNFEEYALYENVYREVSVKNYTFKKTFTESSVLRFKLNNSKIEEYINRLYASYGKLLSSAIKNYNRSNSKKIILKIGTTFNQLKNRVNPETGENEYDTTLDDIFQNRMKGYFSDSDSVTPIEDGLDIIENGTANTDSARRSSGQTTDDIRKLFDDVLNICADAFNIPRGLMKGDVADVEAMTDNFIAFCINPIASIIEKEINRKLYKASAIQQNTKLNINTNKIKGYDPIKLASSAEALLRIGAVNANWIRDMLDEEEIKEDWANKYMMTKNYQEIEIKEKEENEELKGGDKEDENGRTEETKDKGKMRDSE